MKLRKSVGLATALLLVISAINAPKQEAIARIHGGIASTVFAPTSQLSFGDSITAGYYATGFFGYSNMLAAYLGLNYQGAGKPGAGACDNTDPTSVFAYATGVYSTPSLTNATLYTLMIGTNDVDSYGVGAHEANFDLCNLANMSWLAVPDTSKILAQDCSKSGTWTNDTLPAANNGTSTTVNGSTLTCPLTTTGGPLYIWYRVTDGSSGTFTYNIDGAGAVSVNAFPSTDFGAAEGIVLKRITGVSAGAHSIVITNTSSGQRVSIWALGPRPSTNYSGSMRTLVGDVIQQENGGRAAGVAAYSADVAAQVALLQGDGLPIVLAPANSYSSTNSADFADSLHPNDAGHTKIRNAFISVFP